MVPILIDLVIVLSVAAGAWRTFTYFFWCDECASPCLSGNVATGETRLCRTHALEALKGKPNRKS